MAYTSAKPVWLEGHSRREIEDPIGEEFANEVEGIFELFQGLYAEAETLPPFEPSQSELARRATMAGAARALSGMTSSLRHIGMLGLFEAFLRRVIS